VSDLSVGYNRWQGMSIYLLYKDGFGNDFLKAPKYVCFRGEELVGEFSTRTEAERNFLLGRIVLDGVTRRNYLGIDADLRK
jgi:hypothetical protein